MTDSKIFLDTAPFIYLLDNDENFGDKTSKILSSFVQKNHRLVSSVITCTEYLVVPYRTNNRPSINAFWELIDDCRVDLYPITQSVALKAAEIRSAYKFKTMDSLQLAVACMEECDLFLTNDKQLRQFQEIRCVTIEEWEC